MTTQPSDSATQAFEPLLVSKKHARKLLGVGPTKLWQLKKSGLIEVVLVGKSELVRVDSLKRLAAGKAAG